MAKESRSTRASSLTLQDTTSGKAKADSGQAGKGGESTWLNERGEICIGNKCFTLAINPDAGEVTVRVDRNECGQDLEPIVNSIFEVIGRGGRTIYESTSKVKDKPDE